MLKQTSTLSHGMPYYSHGMPYYSHGMPYYTLYILLALAVWIAWQICTGKLFYKAFPTVRCGDDPKAFWFGITIQALPTLGVFCIYTGFVLGVWIIGFLYFGLFLVSIVALTWFIGHSIRRDINDPRVRWTWRKYPHVYWLFMTHQPRLAAEEMERLLLERPGDRETMRMLVVAYERMGRRDAAYKLNLELSHADDI